MQDKYLGLSYYRNKYCTIKTNQRDIYTPSIPRPSAPPDSSNRAPSPFLPFPIAHHLTDRVVRQNGYPFLDRFANTLKETTTKSWVPIIRKIIPYFFTKQNNKKTNVCAFKFRFLSFLGYIFWTKKKHRISVYTKSTLDFQNKKPTHTLKNIQRNDQSYPKREYNM